MGDAPETLTHDAVRRLFAGGPDPRKATLVLVDGRMYRNEGAAWRLLDDRCYASVKEMIDGP